jgi:hypothetical protein
VIDWQHRGLVARVGIVLVGVIVVWLVFFVVSILLSSGGRAHGIG